MLVPSQSCISIFSAWSLLMKLLASFESYSLFIEHEEKEENCFKFTGYENYLGVYHKPSAKKPWQVAFSCFICTGKTCFHTACSHGCFFFCLFNFWNFEHGICAWSTACSSQWSVPILMAFISTVNELC